MQPIDIEPGDWSELTELLDVALELSPGERDAWLAELAGRSPMLAAQVSRLLSHAARVETSDFLQTLPKVAEGAPDSPAEPVSEGTLFGPYRLLRELGVGGMGAVWLAERADGLITRPVALKFPHGNWIRSGLRERMARERNILASLEHPGIARLYDVGLTEAGDPYLALEYVEGETLTDYCDARGLGVRERLELFLQVIDAVASAHGRLIIHRDLKPANILVEEPGRVRLLDFGIGQLLDEQQSATDTVDPPGHAMTPDYASPEQISGVPLTVASDIYTLGVILCELLTGARPFRMRRNARGDIERDSPAPDAPPPASGLHEDLAAIVHKALRDLPEERYRSAHAFEDDIQRFLSGRPVSARPNTAAYRARKFLRRHKLASVASTLAVSAILAATATSVWQAKVAQEQAERAETTARFITSIFEGVDPNVTGIKRQRTALEILDRARDRVTTELAGQPDMQVRLRAVLAKSYLGLYEPARAYELLHQAMQSGVPMQRNEDTQTSLHLLAAEALLGLGRLDEGDRELDAAIENLDTARPDATFVRANVLRSSIAYERAQYDDANAAAEQALAAATRVAGLDDDLLSEVHGALGRAAGMQRDADRSLTHNEAAYELTLEAHGGNYEDPSVLEAEHDYAASLIDTGRLNDALPHLQRSLASAQSIYGDSSLIAARYSVRLGLALMESGALKAAIELIERGIHDEDAFDIPPSPANAGRLRTLARANMAARNMPEAETQIDASIAVMERFDAPSMMRVLQADRAFVVAANGGDFNNSTEELENVIQAQDADEPRFKSHLPDIYLGTLQLWQDQADAALATLTRGVALARLQTRLSDLGEALTYLGNAQLETGDSDGARESFTEAQAVLQQSQGTMTPARAEALLGLGRIALIEDDPASALAAFADAERFWDGFDAGSRGAGEAAFWQAQALAESGRPSEAGSAWQRAASLLARSPLPMDARLARQAESSAAAR